MANTKRKTTKSTNKSNKNIMVRFEIVAIILIALALFFMISLYFNAGGVVGDAISSCTKGLFGIMAYVLPIVILGGIIYALVMRDDYKKRRKYICISILFLVVCSIFHILGVDSGASITESYSYEITGVCGGFFGALIAAGLVSWLDQAGALIILFAISVILIISIFEISVFKLIGSIVMAVKSFFLGIGNDIREIKKLNAENKKINEKDIVLNYGGKNEEKKPKFKEIFPYSNEPMPEPEIKVYENDQTGLTVVLEEDDINDSDDEIEKELESAAVLDKELEYTYPSIEILKRPKLNVDNDNVEAELKEKAKKLVDTLKSFKVDGKVVEISRGPTVTRYELKPASGVKVSQIVGLSNDISLNLAAKGVMVAPIPGKSTIGIEMANRNPSIVALREVLETNEFMNHPSKLAIALGKDISGKPIIMDLAKMPHLLVAGATGAGKSVCINSLVISLLYKANPNEVKLVMIDPKQVELGVYNGIPHLLIPVVKDAKKAAGALNWAVNEMTERYSKFEQNNVRNIQGYNELMELNGTPEEKMPQIVILIDEFADLMMVAPGDVENYVCRIAQLARAAGMHLVIATQRPVVKFITGNIKANVPSRISFMVASVRDSQTILDMGGAEKLIGKGDMLYMPVGEIKPMRMQCAYISDSEVKAVVKEVSKNGSASYNEDVIEHIEKEEIYAPDGDDPGDCDEFLPESVEMAIVSGQISTSLLQRRFKIGYNRAGRIIDQMEARGIISGLDGNKPRQVLITRDEYNEMMMNNNL